MMADTLVTGATGFVGSELTRQLVEHGTSVRILRRSHSSLDLLGTCAGEVEHAVGDVTDVASVTEAMRGVDRVYHAAAVLGVGGRRNRDRLYRVNVRGTANVVNAALEVGIERLVHTSSMAAFGRPVRAGEVIDETAEWRETRANSAYARSKHEAELEVYRGVAEGLDAVIVNPALVFGVGREGENTRRIVDLVRSGRVPFVPAGGTNVVDVQDVAAGHRRAMAHGRTGERYFLGSENLSWKAIVEHLARAFGVTPPRRVLPPRWAMAVATLAEAVAFVTRTRPFVPRDFARTSSRFYRYDHRKAVRALGCSFRPFRETAGRIAATLDA